MIGRRAVLCCLRALAYASVLVPMTLACAETGENARSRQMDEERSAAAPIPLIHCTDIFHPPADPDDFWDLATVYALMNQGKVDLKGIVFDYHRPMVSETVPHAGDSAVEAVAQLNYLTGAVVPTAVGSSKRLSSTSDNQSDVPIRDRAGVNLILKILRETSDPVAISVVGSSIDVALAANTQPDLFKEKCRAVYLLAGTGTTDPEKRANFCYNVRLDPTAFRSCFRLPCPLYWFPAFETVPNSADWYFRVKVQRYGCFWKFQQREVLPFLSPLVQNYFIYALSHEKNPNWLRIMQGEVDREQLEKIGSQTRYMWSTAALLHLAGMAVCDDGKVTPLHEAGERAVCGFEPIVVQTNESGVSDWRIDESSNDRFIFEVKNVSLYQPTMIEALKSTLLGLE